MRLREQKKSITLVWRSPNPNTSNRSDCATGSFAAINERLLAEINTSRREARFEFSAAWWQGSTKYKVDIVGVGMATDHHRRTALLFAHRVIYATLTRRGTIERS